MEKIKTKLHYYLNENSISYDEVLTKQHIGGYSSDVLFSNKNA